MSDTGRQHKRKFLGHAGRIVLWGRPGVDCVVENISKGGAKLTVASSDAIPDTFVLIIAGAIRRRCQVAWRSPTHLGVRFIAPSREQLSFAADAKADAASAGA